MRRLLYQLAELDGNADDARRHLEWAATRTRGFDLTGARAQVLAFRGQIVEARALYAQTIAAADASGFKQVASGYAAQAALTEALYGYTRPAIRQARRTVATSTAYEPQLRAAEALALAGAADEADGVVRRLRGIRPEDTLLNHAYLPAAEAAILLARNRAEAALEPLRRAAPYQYGNVAALAPAYLRGAARARAGAAAEAIREFQAVLDHRGADPFSPFIPPAQLGLARAYAANGQAAESRNAYEALLATWHAADADLPLLVEARAEAARLSPAGPRP
jgi:hypothetical protein